MFYYYSELLLLFELLSYCLSLLSKIKVKLTDKHMIAVDKIISIVIIIQLHLVVYG